MEIGESAFESSSLKNLTIQSGRMVGLQLGDLETLTFGVGEIRIAIKDGNNRISGSAQIIRIFNLNELKWENPKYVDLVVSPHDVAFIDEVAETFLGNFFLLVLKE